MLARLHHQRFFSLAELNTAIGALIEALNNRTMRHLNASRRALFEATERGALLPLPAEPYVYAEWRPCRAGIDHHVELYGHWYSVPSRLVREAIEAGLRSRRWSCSTAARASPAISAAHCVDHLGPRPGRDAPTAGQGRFGL